MKKLLLILVLLLSPLTAKSETVVVIDGWNARGSGTVIRSDEDGSVILSARHVCMGMADPSIRTGDGKTYSAVIRRIHLSEDVCLITTNARLKSTQLGLEAPTAPGKAWVHTLFPGPVTNVTMEIKLIAREFVPEFEIHVMWFDGIAHPGMSGSGVLNEKGELIGVLVLGTIDSMHGAYVELPYILELLHGINSATTDEKSLYPTCGLK